jgi:hypothetical protein
LTVDGCREILTALVLGFRLLALSLLSKDESQNQVVK